MLVLNIFAISLTYPFYCRLLFFFLSNIIIFIGANGVHLCRKDLVHKFGVQR